jgi:hypothetical protein
MILTPAQRRLLHAMAAGAALKAHRGLDGEKEHLLHPLHGEPEPVPAALVESLRERGLIQSNLKFPAATYLLTDKAFEVISSADR